MNTYKIIFTRENGTQGTDHFTAINERQARKDFGECYRPCGRRGEGRRDRSAQGSAGSDAGNRTLEWPAM